LGAMPGWRNRQTHSFQKRAV